MKVTVVWMDATIKSYEHVKTVSIGTDQVMRLYGHEVGGRQPILAELPIFHIREITREGAQ